MKNTYKTSLFLTGAASLLVMFMSSHAVLAASPSATNLSAMEFYTEDTALDLINIVTSDADGGVLMATLSLSNPALGSLSTGTSGTATSTYNAATGVWTVAGPIAEVNVLLAGVVFTPALNISANFSMATSVSDGTTQITGSKAFIGTAVNDSPVLDGTKSPTLSGLTEDAPVPSGAVGTLVSSLVDFATPSGGVDNVTDPDSMQIGVAVIDYNSDLTCYFSLNDGVVWTPMGEVSIANSRLLAGDNDNRIYCQPGFGITGTITDALTFRAFDLTTGIDGGTADTSVNGGSTAFSTSTDTASLVISIVHDGPTAIRMSFAEVYTVNHDLNLNDIVITAGDSPTVTFTMTLSNPAAGSLSTATSGDVTSSYNPATGVWTASGAVADVNTLLAGVIFTPAGDFSSNFTIATALDDGIAATVAGSKAVTANHAPTATNINAREIYQQNTPLDLTDIVVADVDNAEVTVVINVSFSGAGVLSTPTSGAVTSSYNTGLGYWEASGPKADINAILENLTYTPAPDFAGDFLIDVLVSDGVEGGSLMGTKNFTTFVLTEVTPLSGSIEAGDAVYHFSTNQAIDEAFDASEGGYLVYPPNCSNCGVFIDHVAHTLSFEGLVAGDTVDFEFFFSNGTVDSNLLQVGPFTVRSSGGGSSSGSIRKPRTSAHPNGTLVLDGQTVYLIKDGQRWGFRDAAEYASYGYNFHQVVPANEGDKALAFEKENILKAMPGTLAIDSTDKKTVYMIGEDYAKRGFVSAAVFAGLGYSFEGLPQIDLTDYPTGPVISSASEAHPEGSLVLDGKTVWWILNDSKKGFESQQVFDTYGFTAQRLVKANSADLALSQGDLVKFRDGTLARENGSYYIISDGRKILFSGTTQIGELGYSLNNFIDAVLTGYVLGNSLK